MSSPYSTRMAALNVAASGLVSLSESSLNAASGDLVDQHFRFLATENWFRQLFLDEQVHQQVIQISFCFPLLSHFSLHFTQPTGYHCV